MPYPTNIIDAHHHLWNPDSKNPDIGYVWLNKIGAPKPFGDPTPIQRDYLITEFLAESSTPLVGSVHVQADGAIADPVAETRYIQSISDTAGFPISIVGFVDLAKENAEAAIIKHKQSENLVGIRQILSRLDHNSSMSFAGQHYIRNQQWRRNFTLCEKYNLSFDLQLYPEQMLEAADFLSNHNNIPVIIDHAGSPYDDSRAGFERWRTGLKLLASLENISIKISGLGMFDLHLTGNRDATPYLETLLDLFGKERVLFGSNFPVDKLMTSYDDSIQNITNIFPNDNSRYDWKLAVFYENARRIYKLQIKA